MRARTRAGLIGLALFITLAWVFTLWPQLDLWVSAQALDAEGRFSGNTHLWVRVLYNSLPKIGWLYFIVGTGVALGWRRLPARVGKRWSRRMACLALVSAIGSGVLVNAGLKEFWGRARPVQVTEFGGSKQFSRALFPTDQCEHNCSFVSGHSASGFVLMSVGLMGAPRTRRRWWLIGMAAGTAASAGRILQGGHFLSDTLFSGLLIWATGWLLRELWLRRVAARRRKAQELRGAIPG